jgi:hypothetical protein
VEGGGELNKCDSNLNRMNKFDLDNNNPLSIILKKILFDNEMSIDQKQLAIEKATLEYDRN